MPNSNSNNITASEDDVYAFPLSYTQEQLLILDSISSGKPAYNEPLLVKLIGQLDVSALNNSLITLIKRHEILRTSFEQFSGQLLQIVHPTVDFFLPVIDIYDISEDAQQEKIRELISQETEKPFDLSVAPLFRAILIKLGNDKHLFFLNFHHIIWDGWSVRIFFKELKSLYEFILSIHTHTLEELPLQYADYSAWQRENLQGELLEKLGRYWKESLDGFVEFDLPSDHSRPSAQTFAGNTYTLDLPKELSKKIKDMAINAGVTLNMYLFAAFNVLINRYTGQEDLAVGIPVANRNQIKTESLIGFFANTLVIRTDLSGEPAFTELLTRVKRILIKAYEHQEFPFEKLVEMMNPKRDLSRTPLIQIMFALEEASLSVEKMGDLRLEPVRVNTGMSKFDLTLFVRDEGDHLTISLEYSTDLFNADRIERMAGHYQRLLEDIVENPEKKVWELELLTEVEKHQILLEWNNTAVDYPKDICVHELIERQAIQTPDAVAVVFGEEQLTYKELNDRANQLGRYLQKLGIGHEALVGICMEQSLEMVVGLLGILKAGGAYVPLDPNYPKERLRFILSDTNAKVLISHKRFATELSGHISCPVIYLDDWDKVSQEDNQHFDCGVKPDNLLYVIYTSGSTGEPKGAGVYHAGFVNLINWFVKEHKLDRWDRTLLLSSFSFDLTQKNIFAPLIIGGQLHLLVSGLYDPDLIANQITSASITWINCTPSAFYPLIDVEVDSIHKSLKFVFLGGEPIAMSKLYGWLLTSPQVKLVNTYGPTECTDISSSYIIQSPEKFRNRSIPIGTGIYNVTQYILDKKLMPLPIGIPGELYLGGRGVGAGYIGRPNLTAEKFIPDRFNSKPNARLYKTGDLALFLPDGNIEFLGRIDHQVKIRGFRIELGEIESVLASHPAVKESVVSVREAVSGSQQLIAYLVLGDKKTIISELRQFAIEKLPSYMVPSAFVVLDTLPLNPNGKVDRKALPLPNESDSKPAKTYVVPRAPLEIMLAKIWSDVLGVEKIGVEDDFFELGGYSLLAIQAVNETNKQMGYKCLSLTKFLKYPSIAKLSSTIGSSEQKNPEPTLLIDKMPLLPYQKWVFHQSRIPPELFILWVLKKIRTGIKPTMISDALQHIIERHDALRFRVKKINDEFHGVIAREEKREILKSVDLSAYHGVEQVSKIEAIAAKAQMELNMFDGPVMNAVFFNLGETNEVDNRLLLVFHHIVVDDISIKIILEELEEYLNHRIQGEEIKLPPKTSTIMNWAVHLMDYARSSALIDDLRYWLNIPLKLVAELPPDFVDSRGDYEDADATLEMSLPKELTKDLFATLPRHHNIQAINVLVGGILNSLLDWTGQSKHLLAITMHGRDPIFEDADISRTVGFFTNSVMVYFDLENAKKTMEILSSVERNLSLLPKRKIAFMTGRFLIDDKNTSDSLDSIEDKTRITLNFLGVDHQSNSFTLLSPAQEKIKIGGRFTRTTHIGVYAWIDSVTGELKTSWLFSTKYYESKTIEKLATGFIDFLAEVIKEHNRL
jgi:amino acid adenylation domain-containing protein